MHLKSTKKLELQQNRYVERVIKQLTESYDKLDEVLDWNAIEESFINYELKSDIMYKYGLNKFQYKVLKNYIVGSDY
jgi:histidinol phosphatase-like enzyme